MSDDNFRDVRHAQASAGERRQGDPSTQGTPNKPSSPRNNAPICGLCKYACTLRPVLIPTALAALALALPGSAAAAGAARPCHDAYLRPIGSNLAAVDTATACLIDRERGAANLPALRANRSLHRVAAAQSSEMVLGDYFGDDSRSGQTPLQRIAATRYLRHAAGVETAQNIGWGVGRDATPAEMVAAWMASPEHRQIILTGAFRDVGVGVAPAVPAALAEGRRGATYTVDFGTRQP